jgi:hypothetical protein
MVEVAESKIYAPHAELKEDKMRGSTFWLATGVLLFLAWAISYFVFHVAGVLIHLLLVLALISVLVHALSGKRPA